MNAIEALIHIRKHPGSMMVANENDIIKFIWTNNGVSVANQGTYDLLKILDIFAYTYKIVN